MKAFYCDHFVLPLPEGHRFPMCKYRMLRDAAVESVPGLQCEEPDAASDGVLALAHHPAYIRRVDQGLLSMEEQRAIGFPWSAQMVERSRRSTGATIAACRAACAEGVAVNLAGGTHHAHAERGAGFCIFNDSAVAARLMQAERRAARVAIIDLDVHQGDGTAAILARDDSIFTLSLHAHNNYPFDKQASDLDVALADGTSDDEYLEALANALGVLLRRFSPQMLIYLAGADPHEEDRLGRLALTMEGMGRRDRMVLDFAQHMRIPIAITMAGGYGRRIEQTVAIHLQTLRIAAQYACPSPAWR